jgi:hypothetical protein
MIVGFVGVIGSGKSYRAANYVENGFVQINFADALRELAWSVLGWTPKTDADYEEFKSMPITLSQSTTAKQPKFEFAKNEASLTGREFLQRLGNNAREIAGENIWVDAWEKKAKREDSVVVADVRYWNEVQRIIDLNGKLIFCDYRSSRYILSDHPSEALAMELIKKTTFADGYDLTEYFKEYLWRRKTA